MSLRTRLACLVLLFLALPGCSLLEQAPAPAGITLTPLPSPTASRGPLPTSPLPTLTFPSPSATPDPAVVGETFTSPDGTLRFRYPAGWSIDDRSADGETIIISQSPADAPPDGIFVVNLLPAATPLSRADLHTLAGEYLENLLGDDFGSTEVRYREEGDAVIATAIGEQEGERVQYEIRFASRDTFQQVLVLVGAEGEWDQIAPVLDAMARSVEVQPEVAAVTPLPTLAPEARVTEGLAVEATNLYTATTGSLYVVGEVVNQSAQPYEDVRVQVALQDGNGGELAVSEWRVKRTLLPPGERSPFMTIIEEPPAGWMEYHLSVDARAAEHFLDRSSSDFEVHDVVGSEPLFGEYALAGEVENFGEAARFVELFGTLYDAEGRVLATESVALEQDVLAAGEAIPFVITFYSKAEGDVARHEIIVEGTRQVTEE